MITATGLRFTYGAAEIIRDISLTARPGRVLGLIGPNGSGKTTLLRLLHGGLAPAAGEVLVDGTGLDRIGRQTISQRIAVVVQEAGGETTMTAAEMVLLGRTARLSGFQRTGEGDIAAARAALQRVGALDIRYQHEVLGLLRGLARTTLVVLHDINLAARYCDDVVLLSQGQVAGAGTVDDVLDPDLLARVYGIGVRRVDDADGLHLLFTPPSSGGRMNTDTNATAGPTDTGLQARIDGYWDHRARIYDEAQHREGRDAVDRDLWGRVWSSALPPAPARVLDLGTGSGHAAFVLVDLGYDVTGVDSYAAVMDDLPLATADSIGATTEVVTAAGFTHVATRPLTEVLEVDQRLGVAPGHEPRLQYLVRGAV